jgi:hypothetical protein
MKEITLGSTLVDGWCGSTLVDQRLGGLSAICSRLVGMYPQGSKSRAKGAVISATSGQSGSFVEAPEGHRGASAALSEVGHVLKGAGIPSTVCYDVSQRQARVAIGRRGDSWRRPEA